jgi:hypothetical protein
MMPKYHGDLDIHLRPLHTSILDVYKVFETLHWYAVSGAYDCTVIPLHRSMLPKIQVHLRSGNDATTSLLRLIFTSDPFINPY